jgi:hypothetical protein
MPTQEISHRGSSLFIGDKAIVMDYPIKDVAGFDYLVVVLYQYDSYQGFGQFKNLLAIDFDGSELWRAEHPSNETADTYVEIVSTAPLKVSNFAGYLCTIDRADGKLLEALFTK